MTVAIRRIDTALFEALVGDAQASPRRRLNHNFHPGNEYPGHRLLNAIEPDSYLAPHRHLDGNKDESILVLRGKLGALVFDDAGTVIDRVLMTPGGECCGIDIPHGTWHCVLALAPATVMFEAKAGPYRPLLPAERAPWAPAEGSADAAAYLLRLAACFSSN